MLIRRLAPILLLLGAASSARAAGLQVIPVLVELSAREPRAIVVLRNTADATVRLELTASLWEQTPSGQMRLAPAPEITVYPPLLEIAPREERKVRLSTSAPFGAKEQSYRLFIQELPPAEKPAAKVGVRLLTRIGIPVFLSPARPELKGEIVDGRVEGGHLRFSLKNTGTTRFSPGAVKVQALLRDGSVLSSGTVDLWYVLAGGTREIDYAVPAHYCDVVRTLEIEAPLGDAAVRARVEAPGGACAP
jgi:fimbrial chaperone protein